MTRASAGRPSAEFLLLAACCRWPTDPHAVRAATPDAIDWGHFLALVARHRVAGFAYRGLTAAGIDMPPRLAGRYRRLAARNLLLLTEAGRLARLLAAAGIPAAFLKGAALGELAFGDQNVKQTLDNDLLVAPSNVAGTIALLEGAGYRLTDPATPLDAKRLSVLIDMVKECTLIHSGHGAMVDLHWRMTSVKGLLAEPDMASASAIVVAGGVALPTLTGAPLMTYLAVHGARHGWSRIKWLADFNALLTAMDDSAVASLRHHAKQAGVGRCMELALLQCSRLFGADIPADVGRSRRVRWLASLSDALIRGPDELAEQRDLPRRYMTVGLASGALLKARPDYLANLAWGSWVATGDALAVPLPRLLRPLYLVISPARRIGRVARRIVDRGFSRTPTQPMRARQEN
jgi:hypothetical protein